MKFTYWKSGDWNALCDVCGFKFKASHLQKRWDGLMVCPDDWEIRHPQELIRPIPDQAKLPWTRPEPSTDTFINPTLLGASCTIMTVQGVADHGTADCARADFDIGVRDSLTDVIGFH